MPFTGSFARGFRQAIGTFTECSGCGGRHLSLVSSLGWGRRISSSADYQVPADPTPRPYTDPQPWTVQEERSRQARSLEVVHKSFHTVSGQSSGHLYFPMSGEKHRAMFILSHRSSLPLPRLRLEARPRQPIPL